MNCNECRRARRQGPYFLDYTTAAGVRIQRTVDAWLCPNGHDPVVSVDVLEAAEAEAALPDSLQSAPGIECPACRGALTSGLFPFNKTYEDGITVSLEVEALLCPKGHDPVLSARAEHAIDVELDLLRRQARRLEYQRKEDEERERWRAERATAEIARKQALYDDWQRRIKEEEEGKAAREEAKAKAELDRKQKLYDDWQAAIAEARALENETEEEREARLEAQAQAEVARKQELYDTWQAGVAQALAEENARKNPQPPEGEIDDDGAEVGSDSTAVSIDPLDAWQRELDALDGFDDLDEDEEGEEARPEAAVEANAPAASYDHSDHDDRGLATEDR